MKHNKYWTIIAGILLFCSIFTALITVTNFCFNRQPEYKKEFYIEDGYKDSIKVDVTKTPTALIRQSDDAVMNAGYLYKIYNILDELELKDGVTEDEAFRTIVNYICDITTYDKTLKKSSWTDILDSGTAVCNGYAELTQIMCQACKMQCYKVDGYTKDGVLHAWNYVRINRKWYWADLTFYDSGTSECVFEELSDTYIPRSFLLYYHDYSDNNDTFYYSD